MILERMANVNIFNKVRQLGTLSKSNLLVKSCTPIQFGRNSSNLANFKHCLSPNVSNNVNCRVLAKLPNTSVLNGQQIRAASTEGNHVRLWVLERLISVSLPVLIPAALLTDNCIIELVLAGATVMHMHWGLHAMVLDYARPLVVGPIVPKAATLALNLVSALTLAGLIILIYNGPGISKSIKGLWAIGKEERVES